MTLNRKWTNVRVIVWEMDRFLGKKEFLRREFTWRREAENFVTEHNSHNKKDVNVTPDWYTYAQVID
jgi:hypothetical protein